MKLLIILFILAPAYALDFKINKNATYSNQIIRSGNYNIKIHKWKKSQSTKWVLVGHGYLEHCLYLSPVFNFYLKENYNILCYDLPGHGQSSGDRGDIEKFKDYKSVLKDVLRVMPKSEKLLFFGHSTGNVGLTQNLMDPNWSSPFNQIIMVAPLTRSFLWKTYNWAINETIVNKIKYIPLAVMNNNQAYKKLVKIDPYRLSKMPTHWLWQLNLWYQDINQSYVMSNRSINVIFGAKDKVIDKDYGQLFYQKVFPSSHIEVLEDAHHMPYYDKKNNIKEFYRILKKLL